MEVLLMSWGRGTTKMQPVSLARKMNTSRAQLDRLLDPGNQSVTLKTLTRAAEILGMRLEIGLVDT
jgi:antitoxin HicB